MMAGRRFWSRTSRCCTKRCTARWSLGRCVSNNAIPVHAVVVLCHWQTSSSRACTLQVRKEEEKAEVTEYEQLQNELLMKDMELRQSYVKESVMNEAATLRQAWQKQLAMKRKTDVVHKVNDDIITNVGGDVLQSMG